MTLIELFPWLLAIVVGSLASSFAVWAGLSTTWSFVIGVAVGVASFAIYWLAPKHAISVLEERLLKKERRQRNDRQYRPLDAPIKSQARNNLFYECLDCGNEIPSKPKKGARCKCGNISFDPVSDDPKFQDEAKVKMFVVVSKSSR